MVTNGRPMPKGGTNCAPGMEKPGKGLSEARTEPGSAAHRARLAPAQLPGTMDLWGSPFPATSPNNFIT